MTTYWKYIIERATEERADLKMHQEVLNEIKLISFSARPDPIYGPIGSSIGDPHVFVDNTLPVDGYS